MYARIATAISLITTTIANVICTCVRILIKKLDTAVSRVVTQTNSIPMENAALPKRSHCGEQLAPNGTLAIKLNWHCNRAEMKTELAALDGSLE
jgi:hypothetical protein